MSSRADTLTVLMSLGKSGRRFELGQMSVTVAPDGVVTSNQTSAPLIVVGETVIQGFRPATFGGCSINGPAYKVSYREETWLVPKGFWDKLLSGKPSA